jgi:hypothetical protein
MVNYQTIAELVSQIPVDTWNLLQEIAAPSCDDAFGID